MASYRKTATGWRVEVARHGVRKSSTFPSKARAQAWAAQVEAEILAGRRGDVPDKTFGDLLQRYADEVSIHKRGERWERLRIGLLQRDELARARLPDLSATDFAAWRDRRLRQVSAASVRREWTLLSHACTVAAREWRWLRDNPLAQVRRPAPPRHRERRLSDEEIERLLFALGYEPDLPPVTQSARVGAALLFAIETALRAGEIVAMRWDDVDLQRRFLRVAGHAGGGKTMAARRDVPLSTEARRILLQLDHVRDDDGRVFRVSSANLDGLFRKARERALINDLHFHDTRHEAVTRLAKKLPIMDLARMIGHRDLRQLMVYYNESATDMAERLG